MDLFLSGINTAMQSQAHYYKATEASILALMAISKHNVAVREWMYEHRDSLVWALQWLRTNVRPPTYYQVRSRVCVCVCARVRTFVYVCECV